MRTPVSLGILPILLTGVGQPQHDCRGLRGKEPVHALSSVTFRVAKGEFVSIVGPSGCSKSSFLKISLGVVPYSGAAHLLSGVPIAGPQVGTGIVFQTASLPPWRNVLNNVSLPIEVLGLQFQHKLPKETSRVLTIVRAQRGGRMESAAGCGIDNKGSKRWRA